MLLRERITRFKGRVYRTASGLFIASVAVPRHQNVLAVLREEDGQEALLIPASNIVTDAGDLHYAQKIVGDTPTNAFGVHELATAGTPGKSADRSAFTLIGSTEKAHAATYPKVNDGDADNTGAGVDIVSYLASYAKGDFSATGITHGIITNATPGASEPLLTGYAFASSFDKTSNDSLKVFVNHQQNGV